MNKIIKVILVIVMIYSLMIVSFGQTNPMRLFKIMISEHPFEEGEIISSAEEFCGVNNIVTDIFFKTGGGINIKTLNITISNDLTEEKKVEVTVHEECHKRQILNGDFNFTENNVTTHECLEIMIELERECKYEGRGIKWERKQ